jgi:hypothetical protein
MESIAPIILAEREGEHLWFDGGLLTFKAAGADTAGALLLVEVLQPKGQGTSVARAPRSGRDLLSA